MSDTPQPPKLGTIGWTDLTVPDATRVAEFYRQVAGWGVQPLSMGEYDDYVMTAGDTGVAGVCHARGANEGLPAQWLIYVSVADLEASLAHTRELGGEVVVGPRDLGAYGTMAVIRDPAGAVLGLIQPPA